MYGQTLAADIQCPASRLPRQLCGACATKLRVIPEHLRVVNEDFCYRAVDDSDVVEYEHCPVLVATIQADPAPRPDEVASWRWVNWDRLVWVAADAVAD